MKTRETRSEREARRYAAVRQVTYDSKLAARLRGWSDKKIREQYGIDTTRKRTLRPMPTEAVAQRRRTSFRLRLAKFEAAKDLGYTVKEAKKLQHKSWAEIQRVAKPHVPKESKIDLWKRWSKKKAFPKHIKRQARDINLANNLDPNAKYGWSIMFYAFTQGRDIKQLQLRYEPDRFDGDRYRDMVTGVWNDAT